MSTPAAAPLTTHDVVIAGGSFAGLALAAALSKVSGGDLSVAVVSPAFPALATDTPPADARASALSRASLNLLDALGVWTELAPHAQIVAAIDLTDSDLADALRPTVFTYDLDASADGTGLPAMVIVENHRLSAALHRAAHGSQGVALIAGATIATATAGLNVIRVHLSTGTDLSARVLVAADGGRSRLREGAGIKTIGWPYAQAGIITTVLPELPHGGRAVQHFLPAGPFALLPMTDNRICVTWTEIDAEARRIVALDQDGFRGEVERRFGHKLGALQSIAPPQTWPLEISVARTLIAPRFALIGDAAHTLHPIAGQGLNLGFRDAAALAECLVDGARLGLDIGHAPTLERYERWRRFDNLASAAAFDALNRLFSTDATLARSARGAVLGVANVLPSLKSWLIAEARGDSDDAPPLMRASAGHENRG